MKFEIIDNQKYLIDADKKTPVYVHNKYGEYVYVDNTFNKDEEEPFNTLFTGRIKDAVMTVECGYGDVIEVGKLFGTTINVIHFLDREIGEELRAKSLKGWANADFKWIITCGSVDSMWGYMPLTSGCITYNPTWDRESKPVVFDTRDEAVKFITDLINQAKEYVVRYSQKVKCDEDKNQIFSEMFSEIKNDYGSKVCVVLYFVHDMLDSSKSLTYEDLKLHKYGYSIEQYCISNLECEAGNCDT